MKRYSLLITFLIALQVTAPGQSTPAKSYEEIPGEYILVFQDSLPLELQMVVNMMKGNHAMSPNIINSAVSMLNRVFPTLNIQNSDLKSVTQDRVVVKLDSAEAASARKDKNIKRVIKNYRIRVFSDTPTTEAEAAEKVDWGVEAVSNNIKNNLLLHNRVWLLDSGVDPDVDDLNIDRDLSRSFVPGVDYFNVQGVDAHGTHVAGIIGAKRNGRGIVGVAPNALIVAFKIIQNGEIPEYVYYLDALRSVFREANPGDVLNLSIQGTPGDEEEQELIRKIGRKGVKVAIAAGNSSRDIPTYLFYPAYIRGENLYTIASYDQANIFSGFSNYGEPVAFCAPGNRIYSTLPGNRYGYMNGTSQAAPHMAGLLLLGGIIHENGQIICPSNNITYYKIHE